MIDDAIYDRLLKIKRIPAAHTLLGMARAFTIFGKYSVAVHLIYCREFQLDVGIDPQQVTISDMEELAALGWMPNPDDNIFEKDMQ